MTDDLFAYGGNPPSQAHSPTSQEAAASIKPKVGRFHRMILRFLSTFPQGGTDEWMAEGTGISANTFRPRRRELQLMGKIKDSGRTALTRSGRKAVVWVLA